MLITRLSRASIALIFRIEFIHRIDPAASPGFSLLPYFPAPSQFQRHFGFCTGNAR